MSPAPPMPARAPRPNLATAQRNDYENLILLCQNCHARIDGQTGFYSVARLKDIKQAHEAWVRASLPERGRSRTGWTALALRGDHPLDLAPLRRPWRPTLSSARRRSSRCPPTRPIGRPSIRTIAAAPANFLRATMPSIGALPSFPWRPSAPAFRWDIISQAGRMSACSSITATNTVGRGRGGSRQRRTSSSPALMAAARRRAATFPFHYSAAITDDVLVEAGAPLDFRVDFACLSPDDRLASASRPASPGRRLRRGAPSSVPCS